MTNDALAARLEKARAEYDHWGDISLDQEPEAVSGYISALTETIDAQGADIGRLRATLRRYVQLFGALPDQPPAQST